MKKPGSISGNGDVLPLEMAEDVNRKLPYPKGIFFIMATELSERFAYYGFRAVLTIYMRNVLSFSEDEATSYYHIFLMLCYGLPIFWGVVSDSWLGKFRTILYVSILFAVGNVILALSSIPPLNLPTKALCFVGLFLMAVGTAGMKPCVAPLGGEQFILPQQAEQLSKFFSVFFFVVTIGNMVSTIITPIFRRDVTCFGMENCYPLAFGVPAAVMIFAIVVFAVGRRAYTVHKPEGNMLVKVTKCVAHALFSKNTKVSDSSHAHWLDKASDRYDEHIIADTKGLFRVLPYFLPVPMFFALYEQLGSRWTLQATRMTGAIGSFSIKPDQMQVSNALLMFVSLPLFNFAIYPALSKFGINLRTLTKMVIGGTLAAMSFGVAGVVELQIEPSIMPPPKDGQTVLSVINSVPCNLDIAIGSASPVYIEAGSYERLPSTHFSNTESVRIDPNTTFCIYPVSATQEIKVIPKQYQTVIVSIMNERSVITALPFADDYKKSKDGKARARFVIQTDDLVTDNGEASSWQVLLTPRNGNDKKGEVFDLVKNGALVYSETEEIEENEYDLAVKSPKETRNIPGVLKLRNGGSYNYVIQGVSDETPQLVEITPPNNVHILWLLPQYILMAWGEILFIVSGMEFAFSEAPASMKSIVQAIWHLMNAFGNIIVIIAAQNHGQGSQAIEFFIFGGCMFIDSVIYAFLARRYKYVAQIGTPAVAMH